MESSSSFPGGGSGGGGKPPPPPKRQVQLQGPRPSPLSVHKESHKIKKPPLPQQPPQDRRQPVIIYAVSPKIIHANVDNFMSVVQRLTGLSSADFSSSGDVSPAARLASTEKTISPPKNKFESFMDDPFALVEEGVVEFGQLSGILSPTPATLPPVPSTYFSPASDPSTYSLLHDLSPFLHGSPSGLLSARIMSPMASPDVFAAQFWDF